MKILLVDDHPITVEGYLTALSKGKGALENPFFDTSYSCASAFQNIMQSSSRGNPYDLAILDLDLPGCKNPPLDSGKDLALFIRKEMPRTKIIIITAHTELIIIYGIWNSIKPEGFVIKNDLTPDGILKIVGQVSNGSSYKSPMVDNCIREIWKKELIVEDYNRQIIYYLSLGFKVKDLHEVIPLSPGAIKKRIVKINSVFEVTDRDGLLKEVKRLGFI